MVDIIILLFHTVENIVILKSINLNSHLVALGREGGYYWVDECDLI